MSRRVLEYILGPAFVAENVLLSNDEPTAPAGEEIPLAWSSLHTNAPALLR